MADDVFCKVIRGELPSAELLSDERVVVIADINPQAPVHFIVIPRVHAEAIGDIDDETLLGHMVSVGHRVAKKMGLTNGYRMVINDGVDSEKSVPHLHLQVLGGKSLGARLVS